MYLELGWENLLKGRLLLFVQMFPLPVDEITAVFMLVFSPVDGLKTINWSLVDGQFSIRLLRAQ